MKFKSFAERLFKTTDYFFLAFLYVLLFFSQIFRCLHQELTKDMLIEVLKTLTNIVADADEEYQVIIGHDENAVYFIEMANFLRQNDFYLVVIFKW